VTEAVPLGQAARVWARVASLSFGGPAGQIAVMHRILVDEKRWIGERRFLHALNYCMLLPGPEAHQLSIYIGWLMNGVPGGLIAGGLFVLPGFAALMGLSLIYVVWGHLALVTGLFFGLKAAVLAIVAQAVIRVGRRTLKGPAQAMLAAGAFLALFLFHVPFPLVVLTAGLIGFVAGRLGAWPAPSAGHGGKAGGLADSESLLGDAASASPAGTALKAGIACAALWLTPVAILLLLPGQGGVFGPIALFFSQMAVVTFGGAYAVLAYVAQQAVGHYGWLRPGEMVDGLGLAETTPGPLIIVNQFVGFLAAYRSPGALPPLLAGVLGGVLTSWTTFLPSFVWIFLGAPFAERLREARALNAALAAIGAAVVGVILNLALWFGLRVLFAEVQPLHAGPLSFDLPVAASISLPALVLTLGAALGLFGLKLGPIKVLAGCAAAGALYTLLPG
jgi:chromate transporter